MYVCINSICTIKHRLNRPTYLELRFANHKSAWRAYQMLERQFLEDSAWFSFFWKKTSHFYRVLEKAKTRKYFEMVRSASATATSTLADPSLESSLDSLPYFPLSPAPVSSSPSTKFERGETLETSPRTRI